MCNLVTEDVCKHYPWKMKLIHSAFTDLQSRAQRKWCGVLHLVSFLNLLIVRLILNLELFKVDQMQSIT